MNATVETRKLPDVKEVTAAFTEVCLKMEHLKLVREEARIRLNEIVEEINRTAEDYCVLKRTIDEIVAAGLQTEGA